MGPKFGTSHMSCSESYGLIAARFCECSWTPVTAHTYNDSIRSC